MHTVCRNKASETSCKDGETSTMIQSILISVFLAKDFINQTFFPAHKTKKVTRSLRVPIPDNVETIHSKKMKKQMQMKAPLMGLFTAPRSRRDAHGLGLWRMRV